jgi:hypothetical protein
MAEDQSAEWVVQERGQFWWADEIPPSGYPSVPASAVTGELRITREGRIRLDLDGVLAGQDPLLPVNTPDEFDAVRARCIRGVLRAGSGVLLCYLRQTGTRVTAGQCLISDQPFAGEIEKPAFSHIDVDLTGFEQWLWDPGLKTTYGKLVTTLKYRKRTPIVYRLQRGQLSVERSLDRTSRVGETTWREAAGLRFQPNEAMGVEAAAEWHRWLQDLMILLTDSDYRLEWPTVRWGEYHCTLYFTWLSSQAERPQGYDCPVIFPRIRDEFGALFEKWLTIRETYGPGIYHYLGTRRGMELYTESEFTLLVSGLEGFHRTKHGKGPLEKVVKKIDRIVNQIERKKDRDWAESQLSYSTFPNLEDRLVELVEGLALGFDKARVRSFAKACANIRNWLSHGDSDPTMTYPEFSLSVHKKNNALRSLYHVLVLAEMGLDPAMVRAWATEKPPAFRRKWDFAEVGLMDHTDPAKNTSA